MPAQPKAPTSTLAENDERQASTSSALQRSERRYRSLVMATSALVWTTDARGNLIDPHESFAAHTGQPIKKQRRFGWIRMLHPEDRHRIRRAWMQAVAREDDCFLDRGRLWHAESASYRHFEARAVPIRDDDQSVIEWVGTITDIEDRVHAERALKENQAVLDAMFANSPAVICVKQAGDGRYMHVNPRFECICDAPREQILGRTDFDIFPHDIASQILENDRLVTQSDRSRRFEEVIPHHDGELHTYLAVKFPLREESGEAYAICTIATDITERIDAEQAIRDSEQMRRAITDSSPDFIMILDLDGKIRFINRTTPDYRVEEVIGKSAMEFVPEESRRRMSESLQRVRETARDDQFEAEHVTSTGGIRFFESRVAPIVKGGEVTAFTLVASDVTDRRQTDMALRMTQFSVDRLAVPIWWAARDGRFRYVNEAVCELLGATRADLLQRHVWDIDARLERAQWPAQFEELQRVGCIRRLTEFRRRDGSAVPVELTKNYGVFGDEEFLMASATDITDRKAAEAKILQSELRYRSLVAALTEGISLYDSEMRLLASNDSASRILGLTLDELAGRTLTDPTWRAIHEDGSEFAADDFPATRTVRDGVPRHGVIMGVHKPSGDVSWISINTEPLLDEARQCPYAVVASFTDITQRKHAEAEREKMITDLGQKNAELERFTYTVSHDLKSPLITIKGFLGWLTSDLKEEKRDRLPLHIQRISNAADRMERLLNELLELSRVGRIANPPEDVSLGELAKQAVELTVDEPTRERVTIEISPNLPVVRVDATRMLEVYQNLVANAIRFMGDQGHPCVQIGVRFDQTEAVYYVRDNGVGIRPAHQKKIFGLFEQLDPSSGGTGVGLTIVKRIIEVHGGRLWVESEEGRGATFCFTIA